MKKTIKRAQSENLFSVLSNVSLLRVAKTKYLAFTAAAFMLASCSNDDFNIDNLKDTPITVTAGVEGMLTRAGYETDKDDATRSVLPQTFYLTVLQTEEASQYNYYNMEMAKTAGENKYTATDNLLWKDANRSPFVSAYTIAGTTFAVQTDQRTAENVNTSDLLGAIKESGNTSDDVTITGDQIAINFRHLLCKLDITFSWGTELNSATDKTINGVVYQGFGGDVTLDRESCTITQGETIANILAYVDGTTSEAIFAPQMGETPKVVITALIDNVERIFSLNVTAPAGGFVPGNRYTMNVTIGGTSVEGGSVTATLANGWEAGDANGEENDGTTGDMATN